MTLEVLGFTDEVNANEGRQAPTSPKRQVVVKCNGLAHNLAITELQSPDSRNLAIKHAAQNGVTNARCEMPSAPYPVDATGAEVVNPVEQEIDHYRIDVPISTGL